MKKGNRTFDGEKYMIFFFILIVYIIWIINIFFSFRSVKKRGDWSYTGTQTHKEGQLLNGKTFGNRTVIKKLGK